MYQNIRIAGFIFLLLLSQINNKTTAQYTTQGLCAQNGNTFSLLATADAPYVGRFWKNTKIDLMHDFELNFNIAFGSADYSNGLAFLLQSTQQPTASVPGIGFDDQTNTSFGCATIANMFGVTMPVDGQFCSVGQNTAYFPVTSQPRIDMVKNNFKCNQANYFGTFGLIAQGGSFGYYFYQPYKITYVKNTNTVSAYFNNVLIKSAVVDLSALLGSSDAWWGFSAGLYAYAGFPKVQVIDPPVINSFTPTNGVGGTVITISGSGFTGATSVSFGGVMASWFTVVDDATIVAVVGGANAGNVSVTTPAGTTSLGGFTAVPLPIINSFTPVAGPPGTLVTISGSNLDNPASFTIGGLPALIISNDGNKLVGMIMPGATTGYITIATTGGIFTASGNFTVAATPFPARQQGAKLVGTGAAGASNQGYKVAVSADGNTAIIGGNLDNANAGAAWVFTRLGDVWTQQGTKLVGTGAIGVAYQGASVAISADGNTAVVGGSWDSAHTGAAWVFTRSGDVWTQQGTKLVGTGATGFAEQGSSVAISADGNIVIIGGGQDNSQTGAVWVFTRSAGVWTQQGAKLVGTGAIGGALQGHSISLSSDGNTMIVGGFNDNAQIGAAWIFTRSGSVWSQQGEKLVGAGGVGIGLQGASVAISADGNTALVGGFRDNSDIGAAWVFTRTGNVWSQQGPKLVAPVLGVSQQGISVAISADGNSAVVGGYLDNNYIGAARAYTRSGNVWTLQPVQLSGSGNTGNSFQGSSISISSDGTTTLIGGMGDNSNAGAAWVFTPCVAPSVTAPSPANQVVGQYATSSNLTVTATGTSLSYQWYSSGSGDNTGGVSLGSANGAQTNSYSPPTTNFGTAYYYCVVTSLCGTISSSTALVTVSKNTWTGAVGTAWDVAGNWLLNTVPQGYEDVIIPTGAPRYPVLTASTSVNNLELQQDATVSIGNNTFVVGDIQGIGTISGSPQSRLSINNNMGFGFTTLYFTPGSQVLKDLVLAGNAVTLGSPLTISGGTAASGPGTVYSNSNTAVLNSFGKLTLQSNQYGTASIAPNFFSSNYINGEVTIERFIPDNGFRSWRLLSVPTYGNGQTIRQAWQEGDANPLPMQNNLVGLGTQITGTGSLATAQAAGFDNTSASAALLNWNGNGWSSVTNTNSPVETNKGYFLYVRGDRSKGTAGAVTNTSSTTLRTTGNIYQGDQPTINLNANSFNLIGNTYPSAINFLSIDRTGDVNNLFYIWDSKKLNGSSLGAYQTFSATNGYECILGGGSYTVGQPNYLIESGQAFFVKTGVSPGTVTLREYAKVSSNTNLGFRPTGNPAKIESRLYSAGNDNMLDAAVVVQDAAYSSEVGNEDASKLGNPGANFAIEKNGQILAIEGTAPVEEKDTIQFRMWNLAKQNYRLQFDFVNLEADAGLTAGLEDAYLKTFTPLATSGITSINFTVNDSAGSLAANRFRILLSKKKAVSTPLEVTGVTVTPNPVQQNTMQLLFKNEPAGKYRLEVISYAGTIVCKATIAHPGGTITHQVELPAVLASGNYHCEILSPNGTRTLQALMIDKK